jgi:hypothetical protein
MKTKVTLLRSVSKRMALGVQVCIAAATFEALAQQPVATKKETTPAGYLSKSSPSGLRFAAPPKPPVAYLPPLPITFDPQPVYTFEFASPMQDLPKPSNAGAPPPKIAVPQVPGPEIVSPLYNNPGSRQGGGQIPMTSGEVGIVSPQMLVKFFQVGQPEVQMLMSNPVSFKAPVREERPSSSATYEQK